jgi:transcriptional regulator with XRE-family HTH domain
MEKSPTKNSRPGRLKGLYPDGKTIRDQRLAKGWTQKQLAEKAGGLFLRSLQRAEAGRDRMDPAMLGNIATALDVDFDKVFITPPSEKQSLARHPSRHEIRLSPTVSADEILKLFSDIKHIAFGLEGDPSADQAEKVARTVELIDLLHSCGRTSDKISFPDQIRKRGELNDLLKSLNATGLRIFIGCQTRRHSAFGELIVTLKDYDAWRGDGFSLEAAHHHIRGFCGGIPGPPDCDNSQNHCRRGLGL